MSTNPVRSVEANLNEFSTLNRRRLFGAPPLDVADLERWGELRSALEEHYGDQLESVLSAVERRSHFRFPTHLQVRFSSGKELRSACLQNISEGGIFIATERPLDLGSRLHLAISNSEVAGEVELHGTVKWVRSAPDVEGPAGMGICFDGISDEQRVAIRDVVTREAERI